MSDSTTNAQVNLLINGQQAEETLSNLRKRALDLTSQIAKAAAEGDKITLTRLRKEMREVNRQIKEMESATQQVDNVLRRLDKATPRELQKTLATLNKQLDYMERGSDAWNKQTQKIRQVKEEIARVNSELSRSQSFLDRVNNTWNEWQTVAMGAVAAASGAVMAGRAAVQAYADMEGEMANVRKFTGMTAQQVEQLNEAFKQIDTRTSREDLNKLAQEAGRLGKSSQEDVLGFVKAADQINVALDDLGEGATLTLSKLTSIFGDEQRLGTERSLLAVGSVINELSQNCTASAPYLAQFAQRLAGVGAQAKMSIPEIMGFAAVLDSQGQKVEMSATAVSKLIMDMFKDSAKVANAAQLDLDDFNAALQRSTNEGLLMLLQRLHELGGIDVLAPVFKDMGEDGARASAVISSLAANIDMVRWEQEEATKAFEEATSVTNEFNVQNNTAQAGLDKARKGFTEMAVALGQELLPVMRHVISTTSLTMKAMLRVIQYVKEHRGEIITLTSAIVAYTVAVKAADVAQRLYNTGVKAAEAIQKAFNAVVRQNPFGLIAAAVTAAVTAIIEYRKHLKAVAQEHDVLGQAEKTAAQNYAASKGKVEQLSAAVHNNTLSLGYRKKALNELQQLVPAYHASLTKEGKLINDNTEALKEYLQALNRKLQFQAYQDKLAEQYAKRAEKELELDEAKLDAQKKTQAIPKSEYNAAGQETNTFARDIALDKAVAADRKVKELQKGLDDIDVTIQKLTEKIGATPEIVIPVKVQPEEPSSGGGGSSKTEPVKKDKFADVDEWYKRQQAEERISYAKGEIDHQTYTDEMLSLDTEYYTRRLALCKKGETDYLEELAKQQEARVKHEESTLADMAQAEETAYDGTLAILRQRYADGEMDTRTYDAATERLELDHLYRMTKLYTEGSEDWLKAQAAYQEKAQAAQITHQKKMEKTQETYFGVKQGFADIDGYNEELALLEEVYQKMQQAAEGNADQLLQIDQAMCDARLALAKKYGLVLEETTAATTSKFATWLQSDSGEAFTGVLNTVVNQMSDIFSGLTDIVNSELEIQTAAIEARYDAAVSAAEGNKYKEVQLEKEKEAQIAAAKNEANKKMFAMEVMQAVAQTATSAIAAYSSAAAIPIVGFVMAPIAAAMAVAAGAIQIAAIKKEQQASLAQGYSEGGFTRSGRKDEPAGIVHAGEWVASQELLANPAARAIINTLDEAQRTNTIGRLSASDVSSSITAPVQLAAAQSSGEMIRVAASAVSLGQTVSRLTDRLNEPFVTVNTVTGDTGIKRAQDEYNRLIRNKTPKSQRS